jgi:hypothetical protein
LPIFADSVKFGECKPYWKMPELWECNIESPVCVGTTGEQILGCLVVATRLATGWYILGTLSNESADGFSGVFNKEQGTVSGAAIGLEWASFDLVT